MLMALEMPLPKQLLTHSHWTVDRKKMSKSVGNVVSPFDAMAQYGPDVVRFYLARVGGRFRHDIGTIDYGSHALDLLIDFSTYHQDWSHVQLLNHAGDIMSAVGNFYYRCTGKKMMELLLSSSEIPSIDTVNSSFLQGEDIAGKEILTELSGLREKVQEHLHKLEVADALEDILQVLTTVSIL
jgi:methionyl-tRNA synthetase